MSPASPAPTANDCARALVRHLETGDEGSLQDAYDLGRRAMADGVGVMEIVAILLRSAGAVASASRRSAEAERRIEAFVLETISPFEMTYRGAREANEALRQLDEQREDHARRMGRELHDEAGQQVAIVQLALERLRPFLAPEGEPRLEEALSILRDAGEAIRRVSHELRPAVLDELGLEPALRTLAEGVSRRSGVRVPLDVEAGGRLPHRVETALYRAAQEGLQNAVRHAQARTVSVAVGRSQRDVALEIRDDGRGFDARLVRERRGIGLEGIRERLVRLGGSLEIESRPGAGTTLRVRIPLEVTHVVPVADRG